MGVVHRAVCVYVSEGSWSRQATDTVLFRRACDDTHRGEVFYLNNNTTNTSQAQHRHRPSYTATRFHETWVERNAAAKQHLIFDHTLLRHEKPFDLVHEALLYRHGPSWRRRTPVSRAHGSAIHLHSGTQYRPPLANTQPFTIPLLLHLHILRTPSFCSKCQCLHGCKV